MDFLSKIFPETLLKEWVRLQRDFLGLILVGGMLFLSLSFISYDSLDPSCNTAVSGQIHNWGGGWGAFVADWSFQTFGISIFASVPVGLVWAGQLFFKPLFRMGKHFISLLLALLCFSSAFAGFFLSDVFHSSLPSSSYFEGAFGVLLIQATHQGMLRFELMPPFFVLGSFYFFLGLFFYFMSFGISYRSWVSCFFSFKMKFLKGVQILNKIIHFFKRSHRRETFGREGDDLLKKSFLRLKSSDVSFSKEERLSPSFPEENEKPKESLLPSKKRKEEGMASSFLELKKEGSYDLPPLDLLTGKDKKQEKKIQLTPEDLEERARELESVLEEFGIRGDIGKVRPGPVVTLYELIPAPGIKSSRIIGLADDIARSMSAVSTRVSVIPGQNALGIELPNDQRETVYLRELVESSVFERSAAPLALALGKDIGGSSVIVDLARMPHLLVAGTTGSGKSVAINTMILSLLYRLPPEKCKFIMIDPKMLELSIYEGIPHLLAPVVTDPKKAIVALKWTVREMEDRYRAMSKLGVRNIDGYNARVSLAHEKGEILTRRVQIGFDTETGQPLFEDQPLDLTPLPYIVVVVDEMADLMLVAGKEIESTIQRLAQMARAAGIHIIMATQRPSVDVITGTIKANFPTRISFQVTSKIDSRTILGEQGAEQLLGQGDMLYMAAGGRITRLHGPFVKDEDVEAVVAFLRTQGTPSYLEDITRDEEEAVLSGNEDSSKGELYQQALDLVLREGKASTSFIQRHLQIGYNRAARLIDQMEAEGIISGANHVGKREILR
ncbi:MAG TPA: DNA translocase FtsK 4TM domain-containing protein [Alphaproteobacteria bacterium]|nr:DNA translocase FtsK 4TM domain-containing protein [Alphaproteobacteria bacterium]HQS93953.1 DNA translocase FtsK 4TM domain-containing protein [Alphaproteobacteria bacterium]